MSRGVAAIRWTAVRRRPTFTTANEPAITRRGLILGGGALTLTGLVTACSQGDGDSEAATTTTTSLPTRGAPGNGGGTVTVRDVRVFDGVRIVDADTLVVEGGLITALGRGLDPPRGSAVHDGGGGFLVPGLIDAHGHTNSLEQLGDSLRFGVTTVLDMFSLFGVGEQGVVMRSQRDLLTATDRADFWSAGYLITAPGGHGATFGIEIPVLAPDDDVDAFVAARVEDGLDFVKIVVEDGSGFGYTAPTLTADQVDGLVAAAHQRDLLAVVHTTTWDAAEIAVAAGADVLAHVPGGGRPSGALLQRIVDAGVAVVATISVRVGIECTDDGAVLRDDPRIGKFLSDGQRQALSGVFPVCQEGQVDDAIANTAVLHRAGVPILAGTDFSNFGIAAGASQLLEAEMLVRAGLEPIEALRAATSVPAATFGLDDRGVLEVGRRGDLVLVAGDPLDDITSLRDISAIWKNGFAVDRTA